MSNTTISLPTILIADDEDAVREVMVEAFNRCGFTVLSAVNGEDAIRLIVDEDISFTLSDIDMPKKNGFDVMRACDELDIPVILMSGRPLGHRNISEQKLVGDRFVPKPLNIKELIERIMKLLNMPLTVA